MKKDLNRLFKALSFVCLFVCFFLRDPPGAHWGQSAAPRPTRLEAEPGWESGRAVGGAAWPPLSFFVSFASTF